MTDRELMQQALDMLNEIADDVYCDQKLEGVITALEQALETKQWVGLTDEEFKFIASKYSLSTQTGMEYFKDELEAKLKEKNT